MRALETRIIDLQINTLINLMKAWKIDANKFLELDEKYHILEYVYIS